MISVAHVLLFSTDAEADREFFRKVLKLPYVDSGDGWLIFALPPTELAVHPAEANGMHELYLTCQDLKATVRKLRAKKVRCSKPVEREWGTLVRVTLPSGSKLGIYQAKHRRPHG